MFDKGIFESILENYDVEKSSFAKLFGDSKLIMDLKRYNENTNELDESQLLKLIFIKHRESWRKHKIGKQVQQVISKIIYKFIPPKLQVSYAIADDIVKTFALLTANNLFDLGQIYDLLKQAYPHKHIRLCASALDKRGLLTDQNIKKLLTELNIQTAYHYWEHIELLDKKNIVCQETFDLVFTFDSSVFIALSNTNLDSIANIKRLLSHNQPQSLMSLIKNLYHYEALSQKHFDIILQHPQPAILAKALSNLHREIQVTTSSRLMPMILDTLFRARNPEHLANAYILANEQSLLNETLIRLIFKYSHHVFTAVTLTLYIKHNSQQNDSVVDIYLKKIRELIDPDNIKERHYTKNTVLNTYGFHLLIAATIDNRIDLVRKFISMGMPVNPPKNFLWIGKAPLILSLIYNRPKVASFFLHAGVNQNHSFNVITHPMTEEETTPLEYAHEKKFTNIYSLLALGPKRRYIKQLYALAEALIKLGFLGVKIDASPLAEVLIPYLPTPIDCTQQQSLHITKCCFNDVVRFFQTKEQKSTASKLHLKTNKLKIHSSMNF